MRDVHVCVVSSGRPGNVPAMEAHLAGLGPTWYVPADQAGDYRYAGAAVVTPVEAPPGQYPLVWQRNAALDVGHAAGATVVMTDDDLRRCAVTEPDGTNARRPITAAEAVALLVDELHASPAMYAGAAPTDNAYFCRRRYTTDGFVRDGFTAHRPNPLRYDPELPLKLDYDMTLQHLAAHGEVLRLDSLLMSYQQRAKRGGCDYRTAELEDECVAYLLAKWPGQVVPHATRAHEVTIRWRGAA